MINMALEDDLRKETEKWLKKAVVERAKIKAEKKDFLTNIDNYISDCDYFMKQGKPIEAFEAIIWAWSWIEIGKEMGILK